MIPLPAPQVGAGVYNVPNLVHADRQPWSAFNHFLIILSDQLCFGLRSLLWVCRALSRHARNQGYEIQWLMSEQQDEVVNFPIQDAYFKRLTRRKSIADSPQRQEAVKKALRETKEQIMGENKEESKVKVAWLWYDVHASKWYGRPESTGPDKWIQLHSLFVQENWGQTGNWFVEEVKQYPSKEQVVKLRKLINIVTHRAEESAKHSVQQSLPKESHKEAKELKESFKDFDSHSMKSQKSKPKLILKVSEYLQDVDDTILDQRRQRLAMSSTETPALVAMSPTENAAAVAARSPEERASAVVAMSPEERAAVLAAMSSKHRTAVLAAMSLEDRKAGAAAAAAAAADAAATVAAATAKVQEICGDKSIDLEQFYRWICEFKVPSSHTCAVLYWKHDRENAVAIGHSRNEADAKLAAAVGALGQISTDGNGILGEEDLLGPTLSWRQLETVLYILQYHRTADAFRCMHRVVAIRLLFHKYG